MKYFRRRTANNLWRCIEGNPGGRQLHGHEIADGARTLFVVRGKIIIENF
jgi:hypothetical protein